MANLILRGAFGILCFAPPEFTPALLANQFARSAAQVVPKLAAVAQLAERCSRKAQVIGSNPISGSSPSSLTPLRIFCNLLGKSLAIQIRATDNQADALALEPLA